MMKTYSVKQNDITRGTHLIDAADKILGRVATEIAKLLMGKHKVMFSRNADVGDNVTVINAAKIRVTGNKPEQKLYYWHSNYPGGFRNISYARLMEEHPERIIMFAVDGMLPHNHLHDKMMKRLKVYPGSTQVEGAVIETAVIKKGIKKAEIKHVAIKETRERKQGKR
jgi:large subunit ribosomal protein L13